MMGGPARVLLVEDEACIRELVASLLLDEGYDVASAPNGVAALAVLEQPGQPPLDLILLDLLMPAMDGWHFAEAYRRRPGPGAPIVVFTAALVGPEGGPPVGAAGALPKPFDVGELLAAVAAHLGRFGRAPGADDTVAAA